MSAALNVLFPLPGGPTRSSMTGAAPLRVAIPAMVALLLRAALRVCAADACWLAASPSSRGSESRGLHQRTVTNEHDYQDTVLAPTRMAA